MRARTFLALGLILAAWSASPAAAVERAGLDPKLGTQLNLGMQFTDETGNVASLAMLADAKPSLVLLGYDRCPNLCGIAELDLAQALRAIGLPADGYRVLFASIDPTETAVDASDARDKLAAATGGADLTSWRFITGSADQDLSLEAAVGMTVADQPDRNQYVHPIAVAAFTADGRLSQVLSGLDYEPNDLRLALVQASEGKLGTLVDRFVLLCHAFDPFAGQYTPIIMTALRIGSLATIALLGGGLFLLSRRRRPGDPTPGGTAT